MPKSYFKNLYADLRVGRLLLHPILVTAAFLAARRLCYYIIFHFIFDRWYGWDFVGEGIFVFMLEFTCCAYFITTCTHFLLVRKIKYSFALIWAALAVLLVAACFLGYYRVDINHQKEGVLYSFFLASLIAASIYLLFLSVVCKRFLPIIYAAVFVASYALAVYIVFKAQSFGAFSSAWALSIVCPLLWAFYFKFEFKRIFASEDKNTQINAPASGEE
nr:hypothetical protein [uncultured Campylobacter sp.]